MYGCTMRGRERTWIDEQTILSFESRDTPQNGIRSNLGISRRREGRNKHDLCALVVLVIVECG
jgi:hypothetical protein